MDKILNRRFLDTTVATSTTETCTGLPAPCNSFTLTPATQDARVQFNRAFTAVSADVDAYYYTGATGVYAALTYPPTVSAPWTLNSMATADRIYIAVDGNIINALEVTVGNTNSNSSVMTVKCSAREVTDGLPRMGLYLNQLASGDLVALTITDGTASSGKTFGQTGRILLEEQQVVCSNALHPTILKGRIWYEISVSAALDSSVTITGLTVLTNHLVLTAGTAYSFDVQADKIYHRCDTSAGTLKIVAGY